MKRKNTEFLKALKAMPVGTHVIVTAKMYDHGDYPTRIDHGVTNRTHKWTAVPCGPFHAWVTGATWKCDGEVFPPEHIAPVDWEGEVEDIPSGLKVTHKIPVMLVRTAAFSREIAVPAQAVAPVTNGTFWGPGDPAPAVVSHKQPWLTERARAEMRAEAAAMPRDAKGRFLPKKATPC